MTGFEELDFIIDFKKWGKAELDKLISIAEGQGLILQESITELNPSYEAWSESEKLVVKKHMKFKIVEYHGDGISIELTKSKYERKARIGIWNITGKQYWQALIDRDLFSGGPIEKTVEQMSNRELLEGIRELSKTRVLTKDYGFGKVENASIQKESYIPIREADLDRWRQCWQEIKPMVQTERPKYQKLINHLQLNRPDLPSTDDTLRKIIDAGKKGLLD